MSPSSHAGQLSASRPAYSVFLVVVVLHAFVGSLLQAVDLPFGIAFDQLLIFAAIPWISALACNLRPAPFLALRLPAPAAWPWVILASVASFVFAGGLNVFNRLLVGQELSQAFDPSRLFLDRSPFSLAALVFGVVILAPLGEEICFRGYLLRILGTRYGALGGLFVTSLLFALLHLNPVSILPLFALGFIFGLLRILTGSLLPALLAHALQNGITSVILLSQAGAPVEEEPGILVGLGMVLAAGAVLFGSFRMLQRQRAERVEWMVQPSSVGAEPLPPVVEGEGHHFDLGRIVRPIVRLLAVAFLALLLLFTLR